MSEGANSKYRVWVKAIAIVELVFYSISLASLIILTILLACYGQEAIFGKRISGERSASSWRGKRIGIFEVITGFAAAMAVSLWVSVELLQSIVIVFDRRSAINKTVRWENISVILLFMSVVYLIFGAGSIYYVLADLVWILGKLLFVGIVHCYVIEQTKALKASAQPNTVEGQEQYGFPVAPGTTMV